MSGYGFIEREIEGLSRFLAKTILQQELAADVVIDENGVLSEDEFLKHRLFQMVAEGRINEAEDDLFERMEANPRKEYLPIAVQFYDKINKMDDDALKRCNYSREEIIEGLASVKKLFKAE